MPNFNPELNCLDPMGGLGKKVERLDVRKLGDDFRLVAEGVWENRRTGKMETRLPEPAERHIMLASDWVRQRRLGDGQYHWWTSASREGVSWKRAFV